MKHNYCMMAKKYKIMHVMLHRDSGGVGVVFDQYNRVLNDSYDIISLIHPDCQNKPSITANTQHCIEMPMHKNFLLTALHLRKLIKKHHINLVIGHGSKALNLMAVGMMGLATPKISVRHKFFSSKFSAFQWRLKADISISVNKKIAADIGKNAHTIYNAVISQPPPDIKAQPLIELSRPIRIGFLGRIVHDKGVQFIIKALGLLSAKKHLSYEVLIGGDGKYVQALKNLVFLHGLDKYVKFIKYVYDKKQFFDYIDIFCLPSLNESFGLVLIESMTYGVPVIASDIDGINEVVEHEKIWHLNLALKPKPVCYC